MYAAEHGIVDVAFAVDDECLELHGCGHDSQWRGVGALGEHVRVGTGVEGGQVECGGRRRVEGVDCYQQFVVGLYATEVVACLHCAVSHGRYVGEIGQCCLLRGARGQRNHAKQREKQIGTVHYMLHANLTNHSFNNVANL